MIKDPSDKRDIKTNLILNRKISLAGLKFGSVLRSHLRTHIITDAHKSDLSEVKK